MSSWRSRLRDELPRGWWCSQRWWLTGLGEVVVGLLATFAAVVLTRTVARAWRAREDPSALRGMDRVIEGYVGSVVLHGVGLAGLLLPGVRAGLGSAPAAVLIVLIAWCAENLAVGLWAGVIIARSRWRCRVHWSMIDFVDEHAPKNGREPATTEEYQAQRLSASV